MQVIMKDSKEIYIYSNRKDKKAIQMIRNRISAQNSRDRKKAYLKELEDHTYQCEVENAYLK